MRMFTATIFILLMVVPSLSQVSNPSIIATSIAPSGSGVSCSLPLEYVTTTGALWSPQSPTGSPSTCTWTAISAGSGIGGSITSPHLTYATAANTAGDFIPSLAYPSALATPSAPSVTPIGVTGSTTWKYSIIGITIAGGVMGASTTITNGNAVLNSSNFNRIVIPAVSGATSCLVYRWGIGGAELNNPATGEPFGNGPLQDMVQFVVDFIPCGTTFDDIGYTGDISNAFDLALQNTSNGVALGGIVNEAIPSSTGSGFNPSGIGYLSTQVGFLADAQGTYCIAIGYLSQCSSSGYGMAVGNNALAGNYSNAFGTVSNATGVGATSIGPFSYASGDHSIAMGDHATATNINSIALGFRNCQIAAGCPDGTPANSFTVGDNTTNGAAITDWFANDPDTQLQSWTLHAADVTGSNVSGGDTKIAGGRSTGTGTGGSVRLQVSPAGSSGSSQNALADVVIVTSSLVTAKTPVEVNNGTNIVLRCTVAGTLPVGALTITAADCGASVDTGLRVN